MSLGEVFTDATVARLYERRPPYPDGVFTALARRLVAPRTVLDAGADELRVVARRRSAPCDGAVLNPRRGRGHDAPPLRLRAPTAAALTVTRVAPAV
jgi:hypothetical protein